MASTVTAKRNALQWLFETIYSKNKIKIGSLSAK